MSNKKEEDGIVVRGINTLTSPLKKDDYKFQVTRVAPLTYPQVRGIGSIHDNIGELLQKEFRVQWNHQVSERYLEQMHSYRDALFYNDRRLGFSMDFGMYDDSYDQFGEKKVPVTKATIEEIHAAFYNAIDPLLKAARVMLPEPEETELEKKAARLRALGFTGAKEVKAVANKAYQRNEVKGKNEKNAQFVRMVEYFAQKYPLYKFITEDSVKTLCEKYGLIYGPIDRYTGTIPEKNLIEMENFKIDDVDRCYTGGRDVINNHITYHSLEESRHRPSVLKKAPLEMVAPISEFNTEGMKVKNYELMPLDPIVLEAVFFEGKKSGYLIQTAWGVEASDPLVVNGKMN
jgi:hypothetical protein